MIGNRILIAKLDDSVGTKVKFAIENIVNVMGKGMVNILTKKRPKKEHTICVLCPRIEG
jgi:hypothetical protein